jgi:hypothetical protein
MLGAMDDTPQPAEPPEDEVEDLDVAEADSDSVMGGRAHDDESPKES